MKIAHIKKILNTLKYGFIFWSAFFIPAAHAQPLQSEMDTQWATYIIVSSTMPMDILVSLARDAALANSIIVFNGFQDNTNNIQESQRMIAGINAACCNKNHTPGWVIDPLIVQRYHIKAAPSFVIAKGASLRNEDFCVVSGDIDLPNALKLFAQKSNYKDIRLQAKNIYQRAFGNI